VAYRILYTNIIILYCLFRAFGIVIVDDNEKAWFPSSDLKEFHGIVEHQVTAAETLLFCLRPDGSEGLCCPTGGPREFDKDD
jgi:solute carrier family 6 amino acid/orphan transporter-like 15/16/17/18/20